MNIVVTHIPATNKIVLTVFSILLLVYTFFQSLVCVHVFVLKAIEHSLASIKPFRKLQTYHGIIMPKNPGIPCFLFGHSTGGAVVLKVWLFK